MDEGETALEIDLAKRNRLIARYAPELLEADEGAHDDDDDDVNEPWRCSGEGADSGVGDDEVELSFELADLPPGTNIGPLISHPERFVGLNAAQAGALLAEENDRPRGPTPTVGVDEFFDGNGQPGSIATNLSLDPDYPGLVRIRDTLRSVRARPEVADVRISILEWPNPQERADDDIWPSAQNVYIWTVAPIEEVRRWVEPLRHAGVVQVPDETAANIAGPPLQQGIHLFAFTWD